MTKFGPSTILKLFAGVLLRILRRVSPSRFVTVTRSFRASHCRAGCAAIASLLVLSGCAGVQVKLGWKVDLAKTPVTSIAVAMPKATGLAPGEKSPLVVTVAGPDGKVLVTEGAADGKVMWKDLKVEATVVTANQKGVVSLSTDPQISDGQLPHVTITVPSHPDLRADLDIPVQYNRKFQAQFSGASGFSGSSGSDGRSGSSGSSGSTDPDHPSAGGNGEDGGNGGDGGDGGSGGDGPPVDVVVTLKSGSHPLLQVKVVAEGRTRLFLVDPDGGSMTVTSSGGSGGSGGRGGRGGSGGSGGNGSPSGTSGSSGRDGRNGSDGSSGNGGQITLVSDPQVRPYLPAIKLYSPTGPRPVYREMRLAPVW